MNPLGGSNAAYFIRKESFMRTRNITAKAMLSKKENEHFEKQVSLSGLSKSEFLRQRILNVDIKPRPPDEYIKIYKLLSNLANNVNQIAKHANATGYIDPNQMDAAVLLIRKCWGHIEDL